jgi:hypothetical protein
MTAGIRSDDEGDKKNTRSNRDKMRMGHGCLKTHTKQIGK